MKAKTLETYNDRIKIFSDELKDVLKKIRWTAFFRFMVFVVGTALTIYLFKIDNIPAFIVLVTSITTFLAVIIFHGKLKRKKKNLSFLIDINNEEIQRLNFKTDGLDGGNEFVDVVGKRAGTTRQEGKCLVFDGTDDFVDMYDKFNGDTLYFNIICMGNFGGSSNF